MTTIRANVYIFAFYESNKLSVCVSTIPLFPAIITYNCEFGD